MQGLSRRRPHIAHMERHLIAKGSFDAFKAAFKASNGNDWDAERDAFDFLRDEVIAGLSTALKSRPSPPASGSTTPRTTYRITIEDFSKLVHDYLDSKGPDHRIVFLVDEVGQFIGNEHPPDAQPADHHRGTRRALQGPGLGRRHHPGGHGRRAGRGQPGQAPTTSPRSQGRFNTRLSLSSANTDEVIQQRLLDEDAGGQGRRWPPCARPRATSSRTSSRSPTMPSRSGASRTPTTSPRTTPSRPYQFQLLQKVFESIRKAGATGLHLARGERSMLDAFQTAAVGNGDKDIDAFVPLYDFYPSIESFLDTAVKRTIDQAGENPALEPFDIKLLQVLFLIRYVDEIKGNVDNLATLCLDRIDADRLALKRQIEESLARLEKETLISRSGDLCFFLTNEERDISQEIKSVDISAAEVSTPGVRAGVRRGAERPDQGAPPRHQDRLRIQPPARRRPVAPGQPAADAGGAVTGRRRLRADDRGQVHRPQRRGRRPRHPAHGQRLARGRRAAHLRADREVHRRAQDRRRHALAQAHPARPQGREPRTQDAHPRPAVRPVEQGRLLRPGPEAHPQAPGPVGDPGRGAELPRLQHLFQARLHQGAPGRPGGRDPCRAGGRHARAAEDRARTAKTAMPWPSPRCASTSPWRQAAAACCCPTWWTASPAHPGAGGPSWRPCC